MRRRAFLATVPAVALAGCTASGDEGSEFDADDYTVRGVENSEVYHDAAVIQPSLLDTVPPFGTDGIQVALEFDPDAEYDPSEHDVYLMDGERVVDKGNGEGDFSDGIYLIEFDIDASDLEQTDTFRVVSMNVTGPADEFELEIVRTERDSDA